MIPIKITPGIGFINRFVTKGIKNKFSSISSQILQHGLNRNGDLVLQLSERYTEEQYLHYLRGQVADDDRNITVSRVREAQECVIVTELT